ncbi:MAG: hypothetical protein ACWA47_09885 [Brevirhabdus sp.]
MRRYLTLIALMMPAVSLADVVGPGGKVIDCYCTDSRGGRVELGQEICLFVDGRAFTAKCEMALNNPIWRDTGRGCVSSQAPRMSTPPPQG